VLRPDDAPEVRENVAVVTAARLVSISPYRFTLPFLAIIATGLDVSVADFGVAIAISELCGLVGPLTGRFVDRVGERTGMITALGGITTGSLLAAASPALWVFGVALVMIGQSAILFVLSMGAWIARWVPYEHRGRITGITETSWALALLLGASLLGLIAAVSSWRVSYLVGAVGTLSMAVVIRARVSPPPLAERSASETPRGQRRLRHGGWMILLGAFSLTVASHALFVTFSDWLEETHGFTTVGLAAMAFGLGLGELAASVSSTRLVDRIGKARSAAAGSALMVPAALALAAGHRSVVVGVVALAVMVIGFEYSIVSAIPLGSSLVVAAPAAGLGMLIGAETVGRAAVSIPATRLFTEHGMAAPALICAAAAAVTTACFAAAGRLHGTDATPHAP
jgi:MFS transporter, DHA1 family, inner membrane transport protein